LINIIHFDQLIRSDQFSLDRSAEPANNIITYIKHEHDINKYPDINRHLTSTPARKYKNIL